MANETTFQPLTVKGSVKKQNPVQSQAVSLWENGKFVKNVTITRHAPSEDALKREIAHWAVRFGFQVGQAVDISKTQPVRVAAKTGTDNK